MKNGLYFILFISSLFLVSCIPGKEISFEVLQAAEVELPDKKDSLLILNLAYYPWVDTLSVNILNRIDKPEQYILDTVIISSIFNGFFSIIDSSVIQSLTENQYYELRGDNRENYLDALNIESVNYLCDEFNSSQIIALEYYGLNFEYDYFATMYEFSAYLDIHRIMGWRVYERDMGVVYKDFVKDTIRWIETGYTYDIAEAKLPSLLNAIRDAYWLAGESFAKKISPYWEEVSRSYYSIPIKKGGDNSLDINSLNLYSSDNKKRLDFKVYYNLAVINEKNGDVEAAIESLQKAAIIKPNSIIISSYMKILQENRMRSEKVLKQISNQ